MRILFINTVDASGGAAIVMKRLMYGLEQFYNTENLALVKEKLSSSKDTLPLLTSKAEIIGEKIIDRVTRKSGFLYQYFPFSSKRLLQEAKAFQPDVINLHNTQSGYFALPLLPKLSHLAPVVWTLHDMWSFTGNAAHTFGNTSWKQLRNDKELTRIPPSIGVNTGSWLLRQKRSLYAKSNLTIVTPSLWMKRLAEQSPVFEDKEIHHIFNGVDETVFIPKDKQQCRLKLGLPLNVRIAMFSAQDLNRNNPWKGGEDLFGILSKINEITPSPLNLLMVGTGAESLNSFGNLQIIKKGYLTGAEAISDCLNAADLFIYPTRADNLPNVLVESIACNTPCITSDVGGNREIISHDVNGVIVPAGDLEHFATNTVSLLHDEKRLLRYSLSCSAIVNERFRLKTMVDHYYSLFNKLCS
jgi:glycosyltransferase involved in cell wall biosynthesis